MSKKKKVKRILVCFSDENVKKLDEIVKPYKRSTYINTVLSSHWQAIDSALETLLLSGISLTEVEKAKSIIEPGNDVGYAAFMIARELRQGNNVLQEILENEDKNETR